MKKDIADLWIADLRKMPPQGFGRLETDEGHCCLGRLCVILGVPFKKDYAEAVLPAKAMRLAGMHTPLGSYGYTSCRSLAALNDARADFNEIADVIEEHWEVL